MKDVEKKGKIMDKHMLKVNGHGYKSHKFILDAV